MKRKKDRPLGAAALRRRAEALIRKRLSLRRPQGGKSQPEIDPLRLLHELEVHQTELEMQNAALQEARDRMEVLLEKYTDLYDFAPVGYFALDAHSRIMEVNLTGAALLGVERSRLIQRSLFGFVSPGDQPGFVSFLKQAFAQLGKPACEATLLKEDGTSFRASVHGALAISESERGKWCRVSVSDITPIKQAEEARRRVESLAVTNRELSREIVRREGIEEARRAGEEHKSELLAQSHRMQEQLRSLSHQILHAQEEERKRISRELHDEITQTLVGINIHLEALSRETTVNPRNLKQKIARTQRLVEKSVKIVHDFARELRPTLLDDQGLIAALHAFMTDFTERTGVRVRFTTCAAVDRLGSDRCTVLYRVAHSALTNVAQHAHASVVSVSIRKIPDPVLMEIADNGKSFDVEGTLHARRPKRLGLLSMRERLEMVGGSFSVESAPGEGTTIRAQIPFGNGAKA